jgi:hypothetical protein
MKRSIVLTFIFVFVTAGMSFGAWKSWEDFNVYKEARKTAIDAENSGNTLTAVANYKKASDLAGRSATKDIQAWQINNAAFVLIKQFKNLTAYDEKLVKLTDMKPSTEKISFEKELAGIFSAKLGLLTEAKSLLEQGKALQAGDEPTAKLQSNIDFITWVEEFVKSGGNEAVSAAATPDKNRAEEKTK